MALLVPQDFTATDSITNLTTVAANVGGDTIPVGYAAAGYNMATILYVFNGGGAPINVTITLPGGQIIGPIAVSNLANRPGIFKLYGSSASQNASIAYSAVTTVTVGAIRNWTPSPG